LIVADTSVWVDHFRSTNEALRQQLLARNILMHPMIVAELALGSLRERTRTLSDLDALPQARVARLDEVRKLIERHRLHGRGIGLIDAHLLATTLLSQPCRLWTLDKRLQAIAQQLSLT
jgi:predicted nucleic acid-binding protein